MAGRIDTTRGRFCKWLFHPPPCSASQGVRVFTLKGDKLSRWIGTADTAARDVAAK